MKKYMYFFLLIAGLYWIIAGVGYGFWVRKGPGGGFLPVIAGVLVIIFSVAALVQQRNDKSPSGFSLAALLPAAGLLGLVLLSYGLGLVVSMGIYVFLWLRFIEKHTTKKSLSIGVGTAVVIYVIFSLWLRVPMPTGVFELFL